jgi:biopolymer transport protein ExbD
MKRKRRNSLNSELAINLTPVIDACFLLLIFFMITTTFIDIKGLTIDLPSADNSQNNEEQKSKKDVNIQVSANGEYSVNGEVVSATELSSAIKTAMDLNNNRNVIIHGDPDSEHKFIVYAMDMAQGQGAEGMAFAIEQK